MQKQASLAIMVLLICSAYSGLLAAHGRGSAPHGRGYGGHHGYSSFGWYFGGPVWAYPYYYTYPYASPPTVVTVPSTPPVYIQQAPPVAPQYPVGYWYYCQTPEGYYPYVSECPTGWQQVSPTPNR